MTWNALFTLAVGAALFVLAPASGQADSLKISGAAAVAGNILMPHKAEIEKETGLTLEVTVNGDGNGIKDLYADKTVAAMTAAPIKLTETALNRLHPGSVNTDGFVVAPIGAIVIKFIVNEANPVKSLTAKQIKDIFTGKITSWKEVGGEDQPIMVIVEPEGFGTRSNIEEFFLGGAGITENALAVQALIQVPKVVSHARYAIGYGNAATIKSGSVVIPGVEVKQHLGVATRGAPNADVRKLIQAMAKYGASVQ